MKNAAAARSRGHTHGGRHSHMLALATSLQPVTHWLCLGAGHTLVSTSERVALIGTDT